MSAALFEPISSIPNSNDAFDIEPYIAERDRLASLLQHVSSRIPIVDSALSRTWERCEQALKQEPDFAIESALEEFARALRHTWLSAAASRTSNTFRSPTKDDVPVTPSGQQHAFGYERELCPTSLENRCHSFFPSPPERWSAQHVLFSSGQAAMTAALLYQPTRRLEDIEHLGAYFETPQLIAAIATERMGSHNQTIVAEPVYCDGSWGVWSPSAVVQRDPQTIIVDSTLLGREDGVADLLVRLPPAATVLRIHSGLKLFQQGLELADVGIVTAYSQEATKASATADALRKLRSITGLGLGFAEIAALELPVFLDPTPTKSFEDAVFSNNARLASAVSENNLLFEPIVHPSLLAKVAKAPYCTFRLRRPSGAAYERLQIAIAKTIRDMNLLVANAGSFGFRGHRFEIVRPESGAPFLRVALGCRAGRSLEGVIAMMRGLAGRAEL